MVPRPARLTNDPVALNAEGTDDRGHAAMRWSPVHQVYWVQCPRCRKKYWYALLDGTPKEELWYYGALFRERLVKEACRRHA